MISLNNLSKAELEKAITKLTPENNSRMAGRKKEVFGPWRQRIIFGIPVPNAKSISVRGKSHCKSRYQY